MGAVRADDDRGQRIELAQPARRIVSWVPSDTYTLARLCGAARLVGRTRYCVEPQPEVAAVEVIGGALDPDVERVAALAPDLLVANREDNRRRDVERVEAAGIPVLVSHPTTVAAGLDPARRLAALCDTSEAEGAELLEQGGALLAGRSQSSAPPLRTLIPIWLDPLVVVGPGTFADDLLRRLGCENVAAGWAAPSEPVSDGRRSYPKGKLADLAEARPQLVLLPDEPYSFTDEQAREIGEACAGGSPAGLPLVRRCSGKDLFWYGLWALERLARLERLVGDVRSLLSPPR
ncbi:MAG: ABC transporter substrate-binding protein [Deltaproteobacteria bacterium]|jgi:hypothetical protein|nr:ABC transporter substrate-binding protein [Deltaproteobacteria bacterium]